MIYARLGGKWGQVGQELRRSGLGCRNRFVKDPLDVPVVTHH
jgi:hypothetical protein